MKNLLVPIRAAILAIKDETADTRTYTIEADADAFKNFAPGQFNMVGLPGVGEAPVSLSSLPMDGAVQHTVRTVGRVTGYMAKLKEGDEVYLRGPYGKGWPIESAKGGDLILVGGGLGLASLRPAAQLILRDRDAFGEVALAYGARDPLNILYRDELDKWREGVRVLLTVDGAPSGVGWPHAVGFVTGLLDRAGVNPAKAAAFVCGPEIMMRSAARKLLLMGVPPSGLYVALERRMRCGVGQCGHCQHGSAFVCKDGPVFRYGDVSPFPDGLL